MVTSRSESLFAFVLTLLVMPATFAADVVLPQTVTSPDGKLRADVRLDAKARLVASIKHRDETLVSTTFELNFAESGELGQQMRVIDVQRSQNDSTYSIPVGKASEARDHHNGLVASLEQTSAPHRRLDLEFRAFDDGIAVRYIVNGGDESQELVLIDEQTRLRFPNNPVAWTLPLNSYTTPYEKHYEQKRISEVSAESLIGLPLLMKHEHDDLPPIWMAITEANLSDYAGMYLSGDGNDNSSALVSKLSPLPSRDDNAIVVASTPLTSPWRVFMISEDIGQLIESNIVFHLNEPSKIEDPSWIKPGKTTFPWWNGYVLEDVDFKSGVNTATMKHYIDFCAQHGIPYHSLDGSDIAWYGGPIRPEGETDVTTAAPSIDMPELLRYAKEKEVRLRLWMHWQALKPQLDEAFAVYEQWGIEGVMIDFMDRDDQDMVRWYHEVAAKAAKHHLTVTWHGAYKPTGMERTWPNVLSYEGVLNQEYDKWQPKGEGTPPRHNLNAAFIRMLAGPLDYHQGGMRSVLPEEYEPVSDAPRVQGTRGHQLAMYVVYQNHLPMMADYPAAYRRAPELRFLAGIPANWDETRVLHAEFGKALVMARRSGDDWFVGGMTAGEARRLTLPLHFLGEGAFNVEIYVDDPPHGPTSMIRSENSANSSDSLKVQIPRDGGFVARISGSK